jgi:PiT family inorganic phosphate transporter
MEPLLILAFLVALYMAWNIGANDVANAFGTPVGSGAITFRWAMILAAIFEFSGAFFAGAEVTDTIRGDIVHPAVFAAQPMVFAIGMMAALLGASIWLNVATYLSQPVSTTHAIIGAVIGFGLVAAGPSAIQWHKMGGIASSWVISPLVGALFSFLIYHGLLRHVLHHAKPIARSQIAVPLGLGAMTCVMFYSVLQGYYPRALHIEKAQGCWLAAGTAVVMANLIGVVVWAIMKRRCNPDKPLSEHSADVERFFSRVQVMDACYLSFAHGANDVANAVGPVVGIMQGLRGSVATAAPIPAWVLALGGFGIVLGLATYGYKVLEAVGRKITEVTPTRGFAAEFSTATTVLVCSLLGLPVSTTFVLVGAIMGVGLARGFGAIDLRVVRRIFASWVVTLPISALLSAGLFILLRKIFIGT